MVKGFTSSHKEGLGVEQAIQDVTQERLNNVTYINTTGKSIFVYILYPSSSSFQSWALYVDNTKVDSFMANAYDFPTTLKAIVPNGSSYRAVNPSGYPIATWLELR